MIALEQIQKELVKHKDSPLWKEYYSVATNVNPEPTPDIDYVFVLSARASYLKNPIDNPNIPDKADDYNRMRLGIEIAKKVTALRLGKTVGELTKEDILLYGPDIIYNGLMKHNHEVVKSIAMVNPALADFPIEKITILDLAKDMGNTKGQFVCVKEKLKIENTSVAIVTHAYHYLRVSRMLGEAAPLNPFGKNVNCYAMLVDRDFRAPGAKEDISGELDRVPAYIAKKDLSVNPGPEIIDSKRVQELHRKSNAEAVKQRQSENQKFKESELNAQLQVSMPGAMVAPSGSTAAKPAPALSKEAFLKAVEEGRRKELAQKALHFKWFLAKKTNLPGSKKPPSYDDLELENFKRKKRQILTGKIW
jgi:hypothetical protein